MMSSTPSVEFARFRLASGVTEDAMMRASGRMQEDLARVPGFLGRMLLKQDAGAYADILLWRSKNDCAAAMAEFPKTSQACADYLACMVPATPDHPEADMIMMDPLQSYGLLTLRS